MFLAASHAEKWVDGHLQHRHPDADDEERDKCHLVGGMKREADGAKRGADEGPDHDRFFAVALDEKAGRNGHDSVGDEEGEDEEPRRAEADGEGVDDVGNDGPENIAEQGDDEEHEEDEAHQESIPCHRAASPNVNPRSGDARRALLR